MPPEPLPWERKDLFRDRRHNNGYDRVSEPLGGSVARWRETPSHGSRNDFGRWGFPSDFRRPPGHGKQGSWNLYPEDFSHGYATARSGDRFFQDDGGFRPSGPCRDGRYSRNFRESRASFNQKDWRGHSWDYNHHHGTAPNGPGRLNDGKDQKSADGAPTRLSHPHSDVANTSKQPHSKEQPDQSCDVNESSTDQRVEKESSLASIDWKPLKWSRSGSLTSRGSGFCLSSSSKSAGESCDVKMELPSKIATPDESSSGDAVGCIASPTSLDDTTSRKKPRLGWGEGLAKYEKKKVEGPDDCQTKSSSALCTSNPEPMRSPSLELADKSPRTGGFLECRSPMTPSSVAYSSSPGLDDKSYMKTVENDSDSNIMSPSPAPKSQFHFEGVSLNLGNMDVETPLDLTGLLCELLQNEEQSLVDSGLIKSPAINKLLLLKGDVLKALEMTESEIDSLENELKFLKFQPGSNSPCPESSSTMSIDCKGKPCDGLHMIQRPPPLTVMSSSDVIVEEMVPGGNVIEEACAEVKGGYIDSPGTATSKFMEPLSSDKALSPGQWKHGHPQDVIVVESTKYEACSSFQVQNVAGSSAPNGDSKVAEDGNSLEHENICDSLEENTLDYIVASNKETALESSKLFNNLLPCYDCHIESVEAISSTCRQINPLIKDKFLKMKQSVRFKERILTLKYKAFQYLWKEDLQQLSERKGRTKSQKKVEAGLRFLHSGFLKQHRFSIRSQFASQACSWNSFPASEVVSFTNKVLSDPQIRCYRNDLKMPSLILDKKEKSRFLSNNGLVQDPWAVERERTLINPWTAEEKQIFLDKLAVFGKNFRKISSFLDHKTTADCVEFYYKNHKSDCFKKTKNQQEFQKQEKSAPTMRYLMTSGKKWSKEMNAASLDMLGAASAIVAHDDKDMESVKNFSSRGSDRKLRAGDGIRERSSSYDIEDERETEAADVLAGICASLSSEAMSSCITSSVDHGEGNQDWKSRKTSSEPPGIRCPPTAEVTQDVDDDTCSDESCGYMDPVDWTDEEKSSFLQAFSSYGKDFVMISRCVRTKSRDQCKVFFSKARKCLGLGMLYPGPVNEQIRAADDPDGGQSDTEDACVVENDLATCSDKSSDRTAENVPSPASNINQDHNHNPLNLQDKADLPNECVPVLLDENDLKGTSQDLPPQDFQPEDTSDIVPDDGAVLNEKVDSPVKSHEQEYGDASAASACEEPLIGHANHITEAVIEVQDAAETGTALSDNNVQFVAEIASEKLELDSVSGGQGNQNMALAPFSYEHGRDEQVKRSASMNDLLPLQTSSDLHESCPLGKGSLNLEMQLEKSVVAAYLQSPTRPCVSRSETGVQPLQVYLKKCQRSTSSVHSVGELPLLSKTPSQMSESGPHHRQHTPDTSEKPCRNGDVKLFGQILSKSSAIEKPACDIQGSSSSGSGYEGRSIHCPTSCSSLALLSASKEMDTYAHNNGSFGPENFPVRSYGFWDGNRIQTGYPSIPDSTLLLAKYPAVFAGTSLSTPNSDHQQQQQPPVQSMVNANKSNLGSIASSSNGAFTDYNRVYPTEQEGIQPYRLEMKQQDMFPEVPRKGYEAVSGLQQIKLSVVQADVRPGGTCNGLTDPVAALELHYAKAQQHGVKLASGRGEESWRGQNGGVGT